MSNRYPTIVKFELKFQDVYGDVYSIVYEEKDGWKGTPGTDGKETAKKAIRFLQTN